MSIFVVQFLHSTTGRIHMPNNTYSSSMKAQYTEKARAIQAELPDFCRNFFRAISDTTLARTKYGYALDLRTFFTYLVNNVPEFKDKPIKSLTIADMESIKTAHIEDFLSAMTLYEGEDGNVYENSEQGKARKLSTLRSFFKILMKRDILVNPSASNVSMPKIREKNIIRLEPDEMARLLDAIQDTTGLTKKQAEYHAITATRDLAIVSLFLGTGLRISELVGIDVDDVDFCTDEINITRKGGNQSFVCFGNEVRDALLQYSLQRESVSPVPGHENAYFLSTQRKRMSVAAVENMVKKYAAIAVPSKKITPHKLRSSYGTQLYNETGDLYLVADVLGHKDVNTTKKHYAAISQDRKRLAASAVKLRK